MGTEILGATQFLTRMTILIWYFVILTKIARLPGHWFNHTASKTKTYLQARLQKNMPRNEDKFTWFDYRLSIERLAYIHEHSVKWRITCNYDTEGMKLFPDYVRAFIANISLFTLFDNNGQCVRVQRISIAGYSCKSCGAHMVQSNELPLHFHGEKSIECGFDEFPYHGNTHDQQQEYFGNYRDTNLLHTCSSSPSSTTQTWLA